MVEHVLHKEVGLVLYKEDSSIEGLSLLQGFHCTCISFLHWNFLFDSYDV